MTCLLHPGARFLRKKNRSFATKIFPACEQTLGVSYSLQYIRHPWLHYKQQPSARRSPGNHWSVQIMLLPQPHYWQHHNLPDFPSLSGQVPSWIPFYTEKTEKALVLVKSLHRPGSDGDSAVFCFGEPNIKLLSLKVFINFKSIEVFPV